MTPPTPPTTSDRGFTLVELLIVVVVLGVLSTVTVFAVRGIADRGHESACSTDADVVSIAAEAYLVQNQVTAIPATGGGADRYEQTLVLAGLLQDVSSYYEVDADGTVTTAGDPCA